MNDRSLVIDASVVVKWYVEEVHSEQALRLKGWPGRLLSPRMVLPEAGNAFLKKVRRREMNREDAVSALVSLPTNLDLRDDVLATQAFQVAQANGITLYDAFYTTLALQEDCRLITADQRLHRALSNHLQRMVV